MANKKKVIKEEKRDIDSDINIENIKIEVLEYAETNIENRINELVKKADKKIVRQKNITIFFKNITILILLAIIGVLLYLLYDEGYFDKYFTKNNHKYETVINNKDVVEENTEKENKLDILKEKYSYLVNELKIDSNSKYLKDLYAGKLTNKMKLSITFLNINKEEFTKEDDLYSINSKNIENKYKELFNTDNFKNTSFSIGDITIKYLASANMYIFDNEISYKNDIKREIMNIEEKNNLVKITTVDGIMKDNKIYNILANELVIDNEGKMIDNIKKLNKITYVFKNNNNSYILESVEI